MDRQHRVLLVLIWLGLGHATPAIGEPHTRLEPFRLVGVIAREASGEDLGSYVVVRDRRNQKTFVLTQGQSMPNESDLVVGQIDRGGVWIQQGDRRHFLAYEGRAVNPDTQLADDQVNPQRIKERAEELMQSFHEQWEQELPSGLPNQIQEVTEARAIITVAGQELNTEIEHSSTKPDVNYNVEFDCELNTDCMSEYAGGVNQ